MKPVFIVSTGRAGSMMLARVLGLHPRLLALHEPAPHLNAEAFARWTGSHHHHRLRQSIKSKRHSLIEQVGLNSLTYVESSHYCSHLIPELYEFWGGRFVHLYRNGRDFVRSGLARPWWYPSDRRPALGLDRLKSATRKWLRRNLFIDWGEGWDDHRLPPPSDLRTRIEKISWLWVEINQVIIDSVSVLPDHASMSLQLESFNRRTVSDLLDFIGVETNASLTARMLAKAHERPNSGEVSPESDSPFWTAQEQHLFCSVAGPMMQRLGYTDHESSARGRSK